MSAAAAVAVWSRDPANRRVWPIAGVSACGALWAFCEVAWHVAPDAASALAWMRLSALGWVPLGPVAFHALVVARDRDTRLVQSWLAVLYLGSAALLVAAFLSPAVIREAARPWWGWTPVPGPAMALQFVVTGGSVAAGLVLGWRGAGLPAESRPRVRAIHIAIGIPLVVASLTDVALPLLGILDVPRLGTFSLAAVAGVHFYSFLHYGDSLLVPEGFTTRVFRSLPDGMAWLSLEGKLRAANERLAELLGVRPQTLAGHDFRAHLSLDVLTPPREVRDLECRLLPREGAPVDVAISTLLHRDLRGRPSGVVLVVRDLREVVTLRSRLLTSGRMAAVGELAAGIAHELNNPIAYVRSNLSALRERLAPLRKELLPARAGGAADAVFAEAEEILDESLEGMDRAAAIVRDVRVFSHAGSGARQSADLRDLVEQSVRVARLQMPRSARVTLGLDGLPAIECEPQRLKQLFLNLLVNAGQAVGEDGWIDVAGSARDGGVELRFRDDGCGVAPEHVERIFDPFFTTKPVGIGTGLGLAIAFRIVEEHGGRIDVASAPGAGTEFRLWLPVAVD
jgi:signal transduction histidine kinase